MEASNWIALCGIISGLIAFAAGIWQYARAQKWKRAEFVATQMKTLENNIKIKLAFQMLDWNKRKYKLPVGENSEFEEAEVDDAMLIKALVHHTKRSNFSNTETAIRDCFDELFDNLERFDHFVKAGLVTDSDLLPYLRYWLNIIGNKKSGRKPEEFYESLTSYLEGYGYDGVLQLLNRFKRSEA